MCDVCVAHAAVKVFEKFVWWTAHRRGNAHMAPAPAVRTSTTPRGMRETNPTFGPSTVWPMGDESLAARSATAAAASGGAQTARRAPTASRQPPHLESASTECCVVTGARPRGAGLLDRIARTLPPPSMSADAAGMAGAARRHHSWSRPSGSRRTARHATCPTWCRRPRRSARCEEVGEAENRATARLDAAADVADAEFTE